LRQKQVDRIPGLKTKSVKDFFGSFEVLAVDPGPQKRRYLHDINMLKNVHSSRAKKPSQKRQGDGTGKSFRQGTLRFETAFGGGVEAGGKLLQPQGAKGLNAVYSPQKAA
jgi:hypothetical protein